MGQKMFDSLVFVSFAQANTPNLIMHSGRFDQPSSSRDYEPPEIIHFAQFPIVNGMLHLLMPAVGWFCWFSLVD